ncbi:MAG: DNA translocase FtsK 4TM domain-containing protein [Actinomycetota bacterium]
MAQATKRKPRPAPRGRSSASRSKKKKQATVSPEGIAVGLLFLAVFSALAVFWDLAGPVGRRIDWALSYALGSASVGIPPSMAVIAVKMMSRRSREDAGRFAAGAFMCLSGVAAWLHLLFANDAEGLRLDSVPEVGGVVGAAIAWPARTLLSVWGAGLLIVMVVFVGLLVVTKTPVSEVTGWLSAAFSRLGRAASATGSAAQRATKRQTDRMLADLEPKPQRQSLKDRLEPDEAQQAEEPDPAPRLVRGKVADLSGPSEPAAAPARPEPAPSDEDGYRVPPLTILKQAQKTEVSRKAIDATVAAIEDTMDQFGVNAAVTGFTAGPTVTRYEVELGPAVKVNRVVGLEKEIRYALAAGELRILAPIPGRSAIGIEVPNKEPCSVTLGDVLHSAQARVHTHPLAVGLGKDISGNSVVVNLADMPHVLIAGATGAGKSTCINAILASILVRSRPDQVRLLLIDPKLVELSNYNGVPHLLTPVVTSPKKAAEALGWVSREMEARYEVLAELGYRHIDMYNEAVRTSALPDYEDGTKRTTFPYYLVVVDELADLMMVAAREVEDYICRIAQKARAVGIHLIVATQRPSVDVVTGVIKANIPSRMAFATASMQDSRVILDEGGADRLIGKGDMLYKHVSAGRSQRLQGAWISEKEISSVVGWCRRQRNVSYVEGVVSKGSDPKSGALGRSSSDDEDDELVVTAQELVVRSQLGSTSMLQRKLKVGFARAGRIMDMLEERGVVGPSQGSKPRDVLMSYEELQGEAEEPEPSDAGVDVEDAFS